MTRKKTLSSEDRILWGKVARSTRALPGRMELLALFEGEEPPPKPPEPLPVSVAVVQARAMAPAAKIDAPKRHQPLEKPVKRKLAKGHLPIDARIDLHGMAQSEAHGLLLQFLSRAHDRGLRHVLVITGKGTSMGSEGALRRAVPLWFSLPDFRPLISSYEPAARNHGGEGALYVRLSRHDVSRQNSGFLA
ncbi:DNA mismatch repair protein MutS [Rhizobium sp. Leaf384]|uniref:Smr/MutS family protein n=1 Tax=unclassified Rhizobium TaxID=2613769 RepID=UPI000712A995|nr:MULTISPECIES: Smr/MutS family protein [unclassified Rhizobium]KQS76097.1 DNA mismatch repair protein MutS [Rhizobium sp. Leaf384]KQS85842.1 DNA mismatch repair protein MutS [Rhizobium sp. Leaf383]